MFAYCRTMPVADRCAQAVHDYAMEENASDSTGTYCIFLPQWFLKIGQRQINGHERCFDLMCILEKVIESLLRYGNPDVVILGTLKNKYQISSF